MQLEQLFELLLRHLVAFQLGNLRMAKIDHIHVQCVDEDLVIDVDGLLGDREERVL